MKTDFESDQTFEVLGPNDSSNETEVVIGLRCVTPSAHGYFDPRWGGEPPSGPEFEPTFISLDVPKVNYKGEIKGYDEPLTLSLRQFEAIVGSEVADALVERAMVDASDNGGF